MAEGKAERINRKLNTHDLLVEALKGAGEYIAAVVHYATPEQAKEWGERHLKHIGEVLEAAGEDGL